MKKTVKNPFIIAAVLLAAIVFGFFYSVLYTAYLKSTYPQDFSEYVSASAVEFGIPEQVIYAVIKTESDFDSDAVSSAGAIGLMQLMPSTFIWLTDDILGEYIDESMLTDPQTNIRYGTCLLARLYGIYGNWDTSFAAYNAGIGNVNGWLDDSDYSDGSGNLTYIPFAETRNYVEAASHTVATYDKLYYSK